MALTSEEIMKIAVHALEDKKAHEVMTLDLTGISLIADYFVICTGNSDTQVEALATEIKKQADDNGIPIRGIEGMDTARWVLVDLVDVIVHIFHRDERNYYNIERLWSDARVVETV